MGGSIVVGGCDDYRIASRGAGKPFGRDLRHTESPGFVTAAASGRGWNLRVARAGHLGDPRSILPA